MMITREKLQPWLDKLKPLMADKKKLSLMLGLCAVAMLLWGRVMLKQPPRTAVADPQEIAQLASSDGDEFAGLTFDAVYVDLPERVTRNLFGLNPTAYEIKPNSGSGEPGKSEPELADDNFGIRQAAAGLRLFSTVQGDMPRAVINGRTVAPGQRIDGFLLKEVGPRQVVMERDGVIIRLRM